jgi:tyrosinase
MIFDDPVARREFLKKAGAFGVVSASVWLGGCEGCQQEIANRPTRRNIANLAANDPIVQAYKSAVSAMQALPSSDPRNWTNQAKIHFNHCPHGNWWFLPWHRAYLLYFERICRKLSGYNDFALPYWNWTTSPSIPAVFWGNGNPLFDSTRFIGPSDQADPSWVGAPVIQNILSTTNFYVFASYPATTQRQNTQYGELEATPHNNIHGWVNGDMGNFMSPLDPVFWCHHNILDCLWVDWNINLNNPNTNDPTWSNLSFTEFCNENGQPVTVTPAITTLFPVFDYQFEPCSPTQAMSQQLHQRAALEAYLKQGAPVRLDYTQRLELNRNMTAEVGKPVAAATRIEMPIISNVLASQGKTAALLNLDGVQAPEKAEFYVRVFVNKPDAVAETPISDPHYAGSFGFFQDSREMPGMAAGAEHPKFGYVVDLNPTLRRLNEGGLSGSQLQVTLVPVPYTGRKAQGQRLNIGKLELGVANVK